MDSKETSENAPYAEREGALGMREATRRETERKFIRGKAESTPPLSSTSVGSAQSKRPGWRYRVRRERGSRYEGIEVDGGTKAKYREPDVGLLFAGRVKSSSDFDI